MFGFGSGFVIIVVGEMVKGMGWWMVDVLLSIYLSVWLAGYYGFDGCYDCFGWLWYLFI